MLTQLLTMTTTHKFPSLEEEEGGEAADHVEEAGDDGVAEDVGDRR